MTGVGGAAPVTCRSYWIFLPSASAVGCAAAKLSTITVFPETPALTGRDYDGVVHTCAKPIQDPRGHAVHEAVTDTFTGAIEKDRAQANVIAMIPLWSARPPKLPRRRGNANTESVALRVGKPSAAAVPLLSGIVQHNELGRRLLFAAHARDIRIGRDAACDQQCAVARAPGVSSEWNDPGSPPSPPRCNPATYRH